MSDDWFNDVASGGFLPEDESTPDEQAVSAYAQGYADALGNAALAAGHEAVRRYWDGYAEGVETGADLRGAGHRSDPRRRRPRNLTRPGGRR